MRPIAVEWLSSRVGEAAGALLVPGWFACVGLAWLLVSLLALRAAARSGDDIAALAGALAAAYAAAIVGGIVLPALAAAGAGFWRGQGVRLRWSGMVSYAGFACGGLALLIALRRNRHLRPARAADLVAAPLGAGLCLGRLGCFLAGCDYGRVSSLPWAVRFPAGSAAWRDHVRSGWISAQKDASLPVHPTQLYESLLGLGLCAAALLVARTAWTRRGQGRVFAVVAGGYALGRLAIENWRGDLARGLVGPWSSAQLVCTLLLAALAVIALRGRRRIAGAVGAAVALLAIAGVARAGDPAPAAGTAPSSTGDGAPIPDSRKPSTVAPIDAEPPGRVGRRTYHVGGFLVGASPINRRESQVPPLAGADLTAGVRFGWLGVDLDLMSIANDVAAHRSASLAAAMGGPAGRRLFAAGRVGLGLHVVDFEDPAFAGVVSGVVRLGGEIGFSLSPRWWFVLRPLEVELIGARALGGPIWSYQVHLGVSYRFSSSSKE